MAFNAERKIAEVTQIFERFQKELREEWQVVLQKEEALKAKEHELLQKEEDLQRREVALKAGVEDSSPRQKVPTTPTPARAPVSVPSPGVRAGTPMLTPLEKRRQLRAAQEAERDADEEDDVSPRLPIAGLANPSMSAPVPSPALFSPQPVAPRLPTPNSSLFRTPPPPLPVTLRAEANPEIEKAAIGTASRLKDMWEKRLITPQRERPNTETSAASATRPAGRAFGSDFRPFQGGGASAPRVPAASPPQKMSLAELLAKDQERLAH